VQPSTPLGPDQVNVLLLCNETKMRRTSLPCEHSSSMIPMTWFRNCPLSRHRHHNESTRIASVQLTISESAGTVSVQRHFSHPDRAEPQGRPAVYCNNTNIHVVRPPRGGWLHRSRLTRAVAGRSIPTRPPGSLTPCSDGPSVIPSRNRLRIMVLRYRTTRYWGRQG
jgi:hypothetical protein